MSTMQDIERIKKGLLDAVFMDDLLKSPEERESIKKTAQGMEDLGVKQMIDQAQFIKENLLPRVKKKQGEDSADYIFFKSVFDSLLRAVLLSDRFDTVQGQLLRAKIYNILSRDHIQLLEAELQKYTTLEDIFLSDSLNRYAKSVKTRVDALLKGGK